jgi:hypothetical protein
MRCLILAFFLIAFPATLTAQAPEQQIEATLQRARDAGVPVALLESKAAEGRAKGVPAERIALALARRLETLQLVQIQMRGAQLTEAELGLAADAVQAGVSTAVLLQLAEASPRDQRAVAMAALSQLVQLGHTPDDALRRVIQALRGGPAALMNLPAQAAAARAGTPAAGRGRGPPTGGGPPAGAGSQGRGGPPAVAPPRGQPDPPRGRPPRRGGPPPGGGGS